MLFRTRPYRPFSNDLNSMIALVQASWQPHRSRDTYFHIGDLFWRLREPDYEQELWLWEDEQERLAGFAEWSVTGRQLEIHRHPEFARSDLERQILAWAEARAVAGTETTPLTTYACDADMVFVTLLHANGYRRQEAYYNHHSRRLDDNLETPCVPPGYTVRHLQGPEEIAMRVEGHRAGWQSTRMTAAIYERMMQQQGYRHTLDIVVVAPDSRFAATCNCWVDEQNSVGMFEPVSTHPDYRRQGLGRAMLLYGMKQLRSLGAIEARVCSRSGNPAATRLYESCGMEIVCRDYQYSKPFEELSAG